MGRLGELFGRLFRSGPSQPPDGGIYVRVKCDVCGEVIQARVNPASELSQAEDGQGYFVRKVLVGQECFRPIEVQLRYADLRGTEISREIRGGTSVE
jgi:hypothetical protein